MKKNVDQMTADLYNATKAAYLREFSGLIRNNGKCLPVTVDMMAQLANGRSVDGLALADGTDMKKVIDLMTGYSCGLSSLPRIYKQVARLAGETCEKITVGGAVLNAYGLTDEQLKAKENKKVLAALKKYCKEDRFGFAARGGVYHDAAHRCAVWTDAHALIASPALYNPAAAGLLVDKDGKTAADEDYKYPTWEKAAPRMSDCFSVDIAPVVENMKKVLPFAKDCGCPVMAAAKVNGENIGFNPKYLPIFETIKKRLYMTNPARAAIGLLGDNAADGFIIIMPIMMADDYEKNEIFRDLETSNKITGTIPTAEADTLGEIIPAIVEDVEKVEETAPAADMETVADAEPMEETTTEPVAEVEKEEEVATVADTEPMEEETPAEPLPGWCKDNIKVLNTLYNSIGTIKDFTYNKVLECWQCTFVNTATGTEYKKHSISYMEPIEEAPAATVTDADVLAQAERIKAIYEDMKAEAVEGMKADDLPDTTPIYTAADVEKMIEEATADTYTAEEVAAMVAAAVAEERARHTRRRFAPRLRPVLRRLGRVAAVVLPLLLVALFVGASTASTPAADAETVAQVIDLSAVTVTAEAPDTFIEDKAPCLIEDKAPCLIEDKAPAPSPVKKLAAPSPVKNVADAAECSSQKTDTADTPDGEKTASPMNTASDPHGLTICEGTPWAYTMMNWA